MEYSKTFNRTGSLNIEEVNNKNLKQQNKINNISKHLSLIKHFFL